MNKYLIIIGVIVLIIIVGIVYRTFFLSESAKPVTTGAVKEITITAKQNQWRFEPDIIDVNRGDKVVLTVVNEDDYDHGIGIDSFGISQRMPAKSTIKVEFVATQPGDFPFYCSVPCGEGMVDGKKRTHFDMIGKLHVKNIVTEAK